MNENEESEDDFIDLGIDLDLDLEDQQNSDQEDDEFGNKNYLNIKPHELYQMSKLDSINENSKLHHNCSQSNLERSIDEDEQEQILEFNPDQRPPDIAIALKHAMARRVGKNKKLAENDSVKDSFCPCCGSQIENDLLPITIEREKLGFLGSGVPLFFEWMVFIMILTIILIGCSIYPLIMNFQANGCDTDDSCSQPFLIFNFEINRIMASNRNNEYIDHTVSKINFLATVILILVTIIYQSLFKQIDQRIESRFITPSHFTVMVENIPNGATDEQIIKFFKGVIKNDSLEIEKVVQGYEINDLSKIKKIRASLIKKENTCYGKEYKLKEMIAEKRGELPPNQSKELQKKKKKNKQKKVTTLEEDLEDLKEIENDKIEIRKRIIRIDKSITEIGKSYSTHLNNTGYAFISFKNEENVQQVTDYFPTNNMQRFFSYLFCQNNQSFMGSYIKVSKAPEPGDILWENLVYSKKERVKRRIISLLYQTVSIAISFGLIYCVKLFQNFIKDQSAGNKLIEYISIGISVLTFVINTIMSRIIKNLAAFEKHPTYTQYLISVDKSLGMSQFINSLLISIIVDNIQNGRDLMTKGGVIISIQYNVLINTLFPLFNQYFNMWYGIRLLRRETIKKQGEKCPLTQYEAHKIFEGTTFNADKNYSITIRLMLISCFVAYLCPNVIIWNLLMIFADYWLEKYLLLRRHASPPAISGELFFANIKYFNDLYILIFSIGCSYWQYMIYGQVDDWTQAQLQFSIFYYVMPIQKIISLCSETQANPNSQKTYKNVSQYFYNDYDRANPATSQQAQNEYMLKVESLLKRDKNIQQADHYSSQVLRNSIMQLAQPGKLIPESEEFPFFQNRNINPFLNQPKKYTFLERSPMKKHSHAHIHTQNNQDSSSHKFTSESQQKEGYRHTVHIPSKFHQDLGALHTPPRSIFEHESIPKLSKFFSVQHQVTSIEKHKPDNLHVSKINAKPIHSLNDEQSQNEQQSVILSRPSLNTVQNKDQPDLTLQRLNKLGSIPVNTDQLLIEFDNE